MLALGCLSQTYSNAGAGGMFKSPERHPSELAGQPMLGTSSGAQQSDICVLKHVSGCGGGVRTPVNPGHV